MKALLKISLLALLVNTSAQAITAYDLNGKISNESGNLHQGKDGYIHDDQGNLYKFKGVRRDVNDKGYNVLVSCEDALLIDADLNSLAENLILPDLTCELQQVIGDGSQDDKLRMMNHKKAPDNGKK